MSELPITLNEHEHLLHLLLEHVRDHAVFEIDESGTVSNWNRSVHRVFGFEEEEIAGNNMAALLPPELRNPERVQELLQTAGNTGKAEDTLFFQRKNKQCFNGYTIILRIRGATPQRFAVVVRDMSILMASHDQLHGLATLDQLTGLANRQHMFDMGRVEYRRWRRYRVPMSMVLCDIDNLRDVNERHSIEAGDTILRDVADLLRQSVREVDLVARLDGGTYCALLFSTPVEGASVLADRARAAVHNTVFSHYGSKIRISASLSVSTANEGVLDFDGFFRQTEAALYKIKQQGGDRIIIC